MSTKLIFGGLIAILLLALYAYVVIVGILVVQCVSAPGCSSYTKASFTEGMGLVLTVIGGLVSALVVAELAITQPGSAPMARAVSSSASPTASGAVKVISVIYIGVWVLLGLGAFIVGYMLTQDVLPPLTEFGRAWLGLAIAAAYSYLGVKA